MEEEEEECEGVQKKKDDSYSFHALPSHTAFKDGTKPDMF